MKTDINFWLVLLNMKIVSEESCRETQNTYFLPNNSCRKSSRLWDNVEKCGRPGQATDDNMEHALCMLYGQGLLLLHRNNAGTNTPDFRVIRALPLLYSLLVIQSITHSPNSVVVRFWNVRSKTTFSHVGNDYACGQLPYICIWRESMENPNSNTLEHDRPQHDWPANCVIAQQRSSATFFSLCFHSRKENFGLF